MKLGILKIFKISRTSVGSFKKIENSPKDLWYKILISMALLFVVGVALAGFYFNKAYREDYKNDKSAQEEVMSSVDLDQLSNAVKKRTEYINSSSTIPNDPSI